jgi:D-glycero-alpha-D-manno-heptose-7-phosphate kinase
MKDALLRHDLHGFAHILGRSWEAKKRTAEGISNPEINRIYDLALTAGALSGKISGAGGGGFFFFVVDPARRPEVTAALGREPGVVVTCGFSDRGAHSWRF